MKITPLESWIAGKIGYPEGGPPLTRQAIEAWQLERLRETVELAARKSAFYRNHLRGRGEGRLSRLVDFAELPFTTAEDVRQNPLRFLCVSSGEINRVVTLPTSGTTGEPKRIYFTLEDRELTVDFFSHGMSTFTDPGDRVLILLPAERPGSVGELLAEGLDRLGAAGIAHWPVKDPRSALEVMARERVNTLVGSPVQALSLARLAAGRKTDVRKALLTTDHVPAAISGELARLWGCEVFNHYGMTEMGYGGGVECRAHLGYHLREADLFFEIIDPGTGAPVEEGKPGEIVFTTLTRRGMPLIRYRTGDLGRFIPRSCPCGTVLKTMERVRMRIAGNVELGSGHALYLADLDEPLFGLPGLLDFNAVITSEKDRDRLHIEIQVMEGANTQLADRAKSLIEAVSAVRSAIGEGAVRVSLDIRPEDQFTPGGAGKRRIVDKRPVRGMRDPDQGLAARDRSVCAESAISCSDILTSATLDVDGNGPAATEGSGVQCQADPAAAARRARRRRCALVLAAGYSSRMGHFKPLLPLGRSLVLREAVERFHRAGIEDVRVIVGHRAEELGPLLDSLGVRKIFNADHDRGMFSSVLAGVKSLEPEIESFLVLPVDIPLVKPETIAALVAAYGGSGAKIVYPRFEGLRGHPPVISTELIRDLPADCPGGLAAYLGSYEDQAVDLDVIDQSIVMNCNTPLEYLKLKAYASREDIPTGRECMAILGSRNASRELVSHCRMVARTAEMLAVHLLAAGLVLDFELVKAGGLLHDMVKGQQPDHAAAGGKILEEMGYGRVARIVASHTDIEPEGLAPPGESHLVHMADKYIRGDMPVSLEERFNGPLKKFAGRPEVLRGVERRLRDARAMEKQLEDLLGVAPEILVRKYSAPMREALIVPRNIYLARHGAIHQPGGLKRYIGQTDLPLGEEGVRQAETLARKLRSTPLAAIFSSDLRRSLDTAAIVGNLHGLDPAATPNFREIAMGRWEGLSFDEVRSRYPEDYDQRGRDMANFRPPGAESFTDCARRVLPAFFEAIYSTRGDILLVGHAGVNRILLCFVLGKPLSELFDIEQNYCCLNRIRYTDFWFELESFNEPPA
ncbi:MAG: histidine phosphatase family protein [Syntrophobacteraceae bacterium]|nr:histidine phosphatase family protein [Syntrophobacteraceae bacterium]